VARKGKKPAFATGCLIIFLILCLVLVGGFYLIKTTVSDKFGPANPNLTITQRLIYPVELFLNQESLITAREMTGSEGRFEIGQGESVSMVCLRLEQEGFIDDAELMRTYLVYSGLDRYVQAGQFKLSSAMSPMQIAGEMLDATPRDAVITVLPGWRIEEIAQNVAGSGLQISAEEFIKLAYAPTPQLVGLLPVEDVSSLEGYLFPGIFEMPRETRLEALLGELLTAFSKNVDQTLMDGFTRQGLSIQQAVTLASIVEKEAVVEDEKPMIASVFNNRIAMGMRLETDPTVQYALGFQAANQSWWKSPLSSADLAVNSPYNTYIVSGLPPTPICSPDLGSLQAVAFPADTPYFYFRAACDGSGRHNFAITFEEHLENACD